MKKKRKVVHKVEHQKGEFIRHFIFGAEDGLISTLGFLSGIAGAHLAKLTITIAGMAEVFAAALSMGIGTYLSSKSQTELIKRNIELERLHIKKYPKLEKQEIKDLYKKKGFKGKELEKIVNKIFSNKNVLLEEMMTSELGVLPGKFEKPIKSALIMFFTFFVLAMIPLFPYLLFKVSEAVIISTFLTVTALFLVGAIKTKLTNRNWLNSGLEMLIFGILAALVTYYIGNFISTLY